MRKEKRGAFDVVIPVYRPDQKLNQLLSMLARQKRRPEKVVLMVTRERDGADSLPEACEREYGLPLEVHFLDRDEFDHGGTRNRGIRYCESEIVLCMTQDAVPADERMTEELLKPFFEDFCGAKAGFSGEREILISYGRQLPGKGCGAIEQYTRAFNYPDQSRVKTAEDLFSLGIKTFFASDVCCAYDREKFWFEGGFISPAIFNEDMIFAGKAVLEEDYAVAYAAQARVYHSHNYTCMQQFKRYFDLAVSQTEHPEVFGGLASEGEGIRLVKKTAAYLLKKGRPWLMPGMVYSTGSSTVTMLTVGLLISFKKE